MDNKTLTLLCLLEGSIVLLLWGAAYGALSLFQFDVPTAYVMAKYGAVLLLLPLLSAAFGGYCIYVGREGRVWLVLGLLILVAIGAFVLLVAVFGRDAPHLGLGG